jgi:serine/threonine-protein kinase
MTAGRLLGDRYQVGELLGYGGMAEVHRGRDLRLGRDVAIKMLRTDLARDQTFQMRFRREAQNAASLNHPAIVAVYDTGEERLASGEIIPFIVMEFVNGRTLKEVLAAEGRLQQRRALEICADMCAALEFSHRHGIIHRDIKPGNVMLTLTGQVKVMDFGIARALASGATTMTQTSAVIGTAQYLSPEQARGEAVDARSDVYAAGCVLYELLCGQPPFVGDSPVSVAYQHVREDAKAPSIINPDVTPDVDSVVLKALSKNPANRYQSAAEMRADLLRAAGGRPVSATPVLRTATEDPATQAAPTTTLPRGGPPARVSDARRRQGSGWVLAALALLVVVATVAVVAGLYLANRTPTTSVPRVIGLTRPDAEAKLNNAKLKPAVTLVKKSDCTEGNVLTQDPQDGLKVNQGTEVKLEVCGGPNLVTVPPLVGLSKADADNALKNAGLIGDFVDVDGDVARKGQVLTSDPATGTQVKVGDHVKVNISLGNLLPIPDVLGLTEAQAKQRLTNAGFTNVTTATDSNATPEQDGKVMRVVGPTSGQAKAGEHIQLVIGVFTPPTSPPESPTPSPTDSPTP